MHIDTTHNPHTSSDINITSVDIRGEDQDDTCSHCGRTFTSHIGIVGHLQTDQPVPEAPTYTRRTHLSCPHCRRNSMHRMGIFGHMRIHESGLRGHNLPKVAHDVFKRGQTPPSLPVLGRRIAGAVKGLHEDCSHLP
ncbi:hypothetical protein SprV_0702415700 [Sparganum proliferum]